jgi:hypothetical protein
VAEELSIPSRGYSEAYFTGLRSTGHFAPSTRFRVVSWPVQIRANNLRFFCLIKHKNVPLGVNRWGFVLLTTSDLRQSVAVSHCPRIPAQPGSNGPQARPRDLLSLVSACSLCSACSTCSIRSDDGVLRREPTRRH